MVKENQLLKNKITLNSQTRDLKQENDIIEVRIKFDIYSKMAKINKNGNEYSNSDFLTVDISFSENYFNKRYRLKRGKEFTISEASYANILNIDEIYKNVR